ncbi:MAG: C39 family peptidase [Bacillota bacterium]|jgi:hypothetical protein
MIKAVYYNQNDYGNYAYPSPSNKSATIKSGGCGPTCLAMVVEGLTARKFNPVTAAKFAIACGARVSGGTDMAVLARAAAAKFDLEYKTGSSAAILQNHLLSGGLAIANVGGDRKNWTGVFSDGGHYVVVRLYNPSNQRVAVWDPGYYAGKFQKSGRAGKVSVSGHDCSCLLSTLAADCANRSPQYYLFKKKQKASDEKMTKAQFNNYYNEANPLYKDIADVPTYWRDDVSALSKAGIIKGENGHKVFMRREALKPIIIAYRLLNK